MRPLRTILFAALLSTQLATGCGPATSTPTPSSTSSSAATCPSTPAEEQFGCAPIVGDEITYQPDVLIIPGGAGAIKAWSSDGMTWTIDGKAAGADQIAPGKVVFITGLAVGRVLGVETKGTDIEVSLGPVGLGEVIKEGRIASPGPIPISDPIVLVAPDLPGRTEDLSADSSLDSSSSGSSGVSLAAYGAPPLEAPFDIVGGASSSSAPSTDLPPPPKNPEVNLGGGATFKPECCSDKLGASFHYDEGGVRLDGSIYLTLVSPSVEYALVFFDGKLVEGLFNLRGFTGISMKVKAATLAGAEGNIRKAFMIPVDFKIPVMRRGAISAGKYTGPCGLSDSPRTFCPPLNLGLMQHWALVTIFTAKTSSIEASAEYTFNSSELKVIFQDGKASTVPGYVPHAFTADTKILDTITGFSLGVAGIELGMSAQLCICFGALVSSDGLFATYNSTFALINDANDVAILGGRCRYAQYVQSVRIGNGHHLPPAVADKLNEVNAAKGNKPITASGGQSTRDDLWDVWDSVPEGLSRCNLSR